MAAVVYATPGKLYLTPTNATTGGTLLAGVEERNIRFVENIETRRRKTGVGASSGYRERRGRVGAAYLIIPFRGHDANTLKIAFSHLTTDGATIRPTGGTSTAPFAKMPTFALILRPDNTSEKYIYSPNWALTQLSELSFLSNDDLPVMDGVVAVLEANRPTNATGPAYLRDTAANINSAYGL